MVPEDFRCRFVTPRCHLSARPALLGSTGSGPVGRVCSAAPTCCEWDLGTSLPCAKLCRCLLRGPLRAQRPHCIPTASLYPNSISESQLHPSIPKASLSLYYPETSLHPDIIPASPQHPCILKYPCIPTASLRPGASLASQTPPLHPNGIIPGPQLCWASSIPETKHPRAALGCG